MKVSTSKLAIRFMRRDWRCGELSVLNAALIIAVACVTSVVFFTDRISQALAYQASELLAADLRILSNRAIDQVYSKTAKQYALETAETISFRSMVVSEQKNQLAEIKAVSDRYPLRGTLKISQQPIAASIPTSVVPRLGEVWIEPRLINQLSVSVGDTLVIGARTFKISAYLRYEPDRSGDLFSIAPRVLMNIADLGSTALVQEGSRMSYHLLVSGKQNAVEQYRATIEKQLKNNENLEDISDARQEVRIALKRGEQFLSLSTIVSIVLAFIAVAMAARRYAERHFDTCAILRCLGASQAQITGIFLLQLMVLGSIASIVGCGLGYLAHLGLYQLAGSLLLMNLPPPSYWPIALGFCVGLIGLLGFALPPVLGLRQVPTLRVIRRELTAKNPITMTSYAFGILSLSALIVWQSGDYSLGFRVIGGIVLTALVFSVMAFVLVKILKPILPKLRIERRFALSNIIRRRNASIVQLLAFGIGIMVLLLLSIVRSDLLDMWQDSLPENASNRFVINIQPDQLNQVKQYLHNAGFRQVRLHPMVRGRLVEVNGKQLQTMYGERAKRLASREFNLSWASQLQQDNKIISGKWWDASSESINLIPNQFSVEEGIAKTLQLTLGDKLTYEIAGERVTAEVTSLRSVEWDTFQANFFVLAPPAMLNKYPASYITSFFLPDNEVSLLDNLVRKFPNLTVIDISVVMNQVRSIITRITMTVEYVFVFTLLAGLTVMYAAIHSTLDQRVRENAILRALGASRQRLLDGLATEFVVLGLFAGFLAAFCASIVGYVLATGVFELEYQFNFMVWVVGLVGGALGVGAAGILGTRKVLARPPLEIIRNF